MKSTRGFAAMSKEQRSAIARKGGKAKHPNGRGLSKLKKEDRKRIAAMGGKAKGRNKK